MIPPPVRAQIDAVPMIRGRPLAVVDADEVLVLFAEHLARYLSGLGWELSLTEYRLDGAIRHRATGAVATPEQALIARFVAAETHRQAAVAGAAAGLAALAETAQVIVLTNVPAFARDARVANLAAHGMDYPVIVNTGGKGPVLAELARRAAAPAVFIDDSPFQHASAARHAPAVRRVHFVGSPMVRAVCPPVPEAQITAPDWPGIVAALAPPWG